MIEQLGFVIYYYDNEVIFLYERSWDEPECKLFLTFERGSKQWRVRELENSFISFRTYSRGDEQYLTNNGFVIWT